jgi:hypothetical protein
VPLSIFVGLLGLCGVGLIGAITIWVSLAGANRQVPALVKFLSLASALGLVLGMAGLLTSASETQSPNPVQLSGAPPTAPAPGTANTVAADDVYISGFDQDDGRWTIHADTAKLGATQSLNFRDGRMEIEVSSSSGPFVADVDLQSDALANVSLEATFERLSGPDTFAYGFIIRDNDAVGDIYLLINGQRQFAVFHEDHSSGAYTQLVPWTNSGVIEPTGRNRLRLIANNAQITVTCNEQVLTQFTFDRVWSGTTGIMTTLFDANQSGRLTVDDVRLQRIR